MMSSLLSSFDPSSNLFLSNWILGWLFFMLFLSFYSKFWFLNSLYSLIMKVIIHVMSEIFNTRMNVVLFLIPFLGIFVLNLQGLTPLSFSITSHLWPNLVIGLTFWMGFIIYNTKNFINMVSHFTPLGCPMMLVPFMVPIELLSKLIQPLTLSLRLTANIMAGHMLLSLVEWGLQSFNFIPMLGMLFIMMGLMLFEFCVSAIQAYVFSNLLLMYWKS